MRDMCGIRGKDAKDQFACITLQLTLLSVTFIFFSIFIVSFIDDEIHYNFLKDVVSCVLQWVSSKSS